MYFTKIDDLIDVIIDDFYATRIDKKLDKYKYELNFIKDQEELNAIMTQYIETIPSDEITNIVKKGENYNMILNIIKKYLTIYLFLAIGVVFTGNPNIFINNIIEFTRRQPLFSLKIDNFFNAESSSLIITLFFISRNFLSYLSTNTYDTIKKEQYYADTVRLINELSVNMFQLKSFNNDTMFQIHAIIKTVIIKNVYKLNDRTPLYKLIEQIELSSGDYTFIEIIEPTTNVLNFNTIEALLSPKEIASGLVYKLWDYIVENENKQNILSVDEKINMLINSHIIVPIVDDFLIYHQSSELYSKTDDQAIKDDTKVKYITNKIESVIDFYSNTNKQKIMEFFSPPLYNKKAIVRNYFEDVKIINKFVNQGKQNTSNINYFNNMILYMRYPFINFKDTTGFSYYFTKTISVIRSVSFDTQTEFKQNNIDNYLHIRVGSQNTMCNIVGFMVPTNIDTIKCIKQSSILNIENLNTHKTKLHKLCAAIINQSLVKKNKHNTSIYWLFNTTDHNDVIKFNVSKIYDTLINYLYNAIIDELNKTPQIMIDTALNKIDDILDNTIGQQPNRYIYKTIIGDIEKHIYENLIITFKEEDLKDNDILYGIEGNAITLPQYTNTNKNNFTKISIDLTNIDESGKVVEDVVINGICQHNITWNNISKLKYNKHTEYVKSLHNFVQQYVIEDIYHNYVCTSCGSFLDLKQYINDGGYDDTRGYIIFSTPMDVRIEEIPEYEKYIFSIKIMDKNIDKIASSVGIPYFIGSQTNSKWRRNSIIKYTIDMVVANNKLLFNNLKHHNDIKTSSYGVSKTLSSLFAFDMENNIFQLSTKDKDQEQFKMIKRNNIITYIVIYIILELSESSINFFVSEKNLCDILIFDKIWLTLFEGLRIKSNNTNDTFDITKYKLLCYVIYMITCRMAKHKLWHTPQITEKDIKKLIPTIQKFIIHTLVDIINTIIENSYKPGVSYIFEVFRSRLYSKLQTIFNNIEFYNSLITQKTQIIQNINSRKHIEPIKLNAKDKYSYIQSYWELYQATNIFFRYSTPVDYSITTISNLTNCETGFYHKWKTVQDKIQCTLCNVVLKNIVYSEEQTQQIKEQFKQKQILRYAQYICIKGGLHIFIENDVDSACMKCKLLKTHIYTLTELQQVENEQEHIRKQQKLKYIQLIEQQKQYDDMPYIQNVIAKTNNLYKNTNDFNFITDFIKTIKKYIGNEIKSDNDSNLETNTYIIDHDRYGKEIEKIIIYENDNKITSTENHPHFKKNVIYYTDNTSKRVDIFYDMETRKLIGYKEISYDYVDIVNSKKKIKIKYSLFNKIKLLGYSREYIDIENYEYKDANIIKNISNIRLDNLKNCLTELQRTLNRILNGTVKPIITQGLKYDNDNYFSDIMNNIVSKYYKKLNKSKIRDSNNKHKIFKHWNAIIQGLYTNITVELDINKLLDTNVICKYDNAANNLLYYIINELTLFLKYNEDGYTQTNICNFIIDFFDKLFYRYNTEEIDNDNNIIRFKYVLQSINYMKDVSSFIGDDVPVGVYDEYVTPEEVTEEMLEKQIDDDEENEALDLDLSTEDLEEGFASTHDRLIEHSDNLYSD